MQPQTNKSTKDIGNILKDKDEKAKKARSKKIRDGGTCKSFLRIEILLDSYTLSLTGDPHKHDLDYMDQIKRNNALRLRCEHEIWRQRQPAEILAALQGSAYMQDGRKQLIDAGGEYLKLQDLNNWANAFRKVHPDLRTIGHKDNAKNQLVKACLFLD